MTDRGPSIADIQAARNQKLSTEAGIRPEAERIASELEGAHQDALHIKDQLGQEGESVPRQQVFPHGSIASTNPMSGDNKEHTGVGERLAEGVANTDQTVTTAARDAVHQVSQGMSAAGNAAASAAGAVVDKAKEVVQGAMGTNAADSEGRPTNAYEGAVFSSDDPEYKPTGGVTESRTPAHTLDELKGTSQNPTIATPKEQPNPRLAGLINFFNGGVSSPGQAPIIATPKEPASLGEGSVGVAAGDPAGGANVVAAAHTAGKGIMDTVKGVFSSTPTAGAPAGPSDPDPRTANVPVGDFKALHQALHLSTADTTTTSSSSAAAPSDAASRGTTDQGSASTLPTAQDAREGWEGLKSQAQEGLEAASDRVQEGLDAASERVQQAVGGEGGSRGSGAAGGGLLGSLAGIVSGIATKVNLANSSKELLAGGTVRDAAAGPAAAAGPTTNTAPEAAAAANAASDAAGDARDRIASSSSDSVSAANDAAAGAADSVKEGAAQLRDKAADQANAAADNVKSTGQSVSDAAKDAAGWVADAATAAKDKIVDAATATKDSTVDAATAAKDRTVEAVTAAKDRTVDAATAAKDRTVEAVTGAKDRTADAATAAKDGTADAATAAKDSTAEAVAAAKDKTVDAATAAKDRTVDAATAAKDRTVDAATAAKDRAADAVTAAKDTAADAATAAKDRTVDVATATKDTAADAAAAAKDRTDDAATAAKDSATAAKDSAVDAATAAKDRTAEVVGGAADSAAECAQRGKEAAGGGLSAILQGAKEGFVGAYDAAASVLVGDDKPSSTPADSTGGPPAAAQPPSSSAGGSGLQSGAVGSGHAAAPPAGIGAVLKQGWEDLKHGGAKAPHATSTRGETAASHDVTSNVERSKHLDDEQQAKIYKAETYSVAPGAQAASDQASTDQHKTGAVAGDKRPVTGTVPHDKPDTYKVHADQTNRFAGDKGMGTGFGTGSAAPWTGDDSIKSITALFTKPTSSSSNQGSVYLTPEDEACLVEVATQAAGECPERAGSSTEGSTSSWVSTMSAVWRNLGVASAKGPTGADAKKEGFDNPTQDAVVDPEHGVTKVESSTPGHKIAMRPREQTIPDSDVTDPQFYKDKAERLGKVISDTVTTSSEEAAADPNNLKGKSSDNKPDGLAYYAKLEARDAAAAVSRAPEAAASALGTAGEILAGAAGHVVDKAKELGHNITTHGDFMSAEERTAKSQAAVERAQKNMEALGDIATDHRAVQELQEQRMAAIGDPGHKRETLGDKIIGPLVKDASDDTRAKQLAASYHEWRDEKEHGKPEAVGAPGTSPAATAAGSAGGGDGGSSSGGVGDAVKGLGREAGDTAQAAQEVVKMEGRAAGEGVEAAADKAGSKASDAVEAVKGLATEAADTARAAGEVVSMEVSSGLDAVKGAADQTSSRATDAARDAKHSAQDAARKTGDAVRDTADRARNTAKDVASRTGDRAQDAADSVKDAAGRAGDSVREAGATVGDKVQEGVDAVAEGTGYVVGAGSERLTEAQEAAARAGDKAGAAAGSVLSSVGGAAKALLGNLLGPFEREGAFDESTAAITGPPKDFEPIGAEQLSGPDVSSSLPHTQPPAEKRAPSSSSTAEAPAGVVDVDELRDRAEASKEGIKARVQAGIDDTARAAGLTAGHIESVVEDAKNKIVAVQEKVAEATEDIHVPPAEIPTNTEELLRQRHVQ